MPTWAGDLLYDIDVPTGKSTNITEVIGAEYGDFNKRGGGILTLSAVNEFTGTVTNNAGGLIIADIGEGIPAGAGMVFYAGTYAPLTQTSFTSALGTGPGEFNMTLDHFKIAALNGPLTINFGGNAEPIVSGGEMNPNAKAIHFGWKDNNNEYPITVLNPLKISSDLTLRTQKNAPVTLAGGVSAVDGVTGKTLSMPNAQPSQFRFTETGTLNIPGNNWTPCGGGTTTFDGGTHSCGAITSPRHNIVFTNGAHFVSKECYLGRDNASYAVNVYAYNAVVSNANGNVRLGSTSGAKGNWYMKGGEYASVASGTPSLVIGDYGHGAFYQESGNMLLRNSGVYLGHNVGYTGLYRMDGGTFNTSKALCIGNNGTGSVEVVSGTAHVGNTFSLGQESKSSGRMRMSGGTMTYNLNAMIGRHGRGYLLMTGGTLSQANDQEFSLARFSDGKGRLDITGGEYRYWRPNSATTKNIGWEGTGVVSVASSGIFSFSNDVRIATVTSSYGEIDLREGGVFEVGAIFVGDGYSKIVADGGTFRVGRNGDYFQNSAKLDESYVGRRGVTFDTQGYAATIGNFALDGRSPGVIRKAGAGTLTLTGLPQTGGGIEVNAGTLALASGATVGTAFSAPGAEDDGGNSYPDAPSDALVAQNYLLHRWSFRHGSVVDSIAGNVATVHDDNAAGADIAFGDDAVTLPGGSTKCVRYLDLGSGLFGNEDGEFTVEFWARIPNWSVGSKILTIGNSGTQEIFINMAGGVCARGSGEGLVNAWSASTVPAGTMCHFSIVVGKATNGKRDVRFRLKNVETGETLGENVCAGRSYSPILHQNIFAFGYSYHSEVDGKLELDEVRIWKAALSDAQLTVNALRGPDDVPLLGMEGGSGPVKVASGATFDLGGNTISYPGLTGAGTVRNGTMTVETLNVTGAMRLEGDVTVTGAIVFAEGASLVTTGTLNIAGATVRYTQPISVSRLVLATAESGGSITGTPAAIDLGVNRGYRLSVTSSAIKALKTGLMVIVK
ncbi:MAG: hypothetical protein IJQ00_06140 [Kiritimatiellae bacterium]|nr:hypothetical protein [Kiritimatiellia bacterium]